MKCGLGMIVFSVDEDTMFRGFMQLERDCRSTTFPELKSHPCLICYRKLLHLAL